MLDARTDRSAVCIRHKIYARHENVDSSTRLSIKLIKHCINTVLRLEGIHLPCEVSVLIIDNNAIKKINGDFRGIDATTDVLSFPLQELRPGSFAQSIRAGDAESEIIDDPKNSSENHLLRSLSNELTNLVDSQPLPLGDIVISAERVRTQAVEFGNTLEHETAYLTIHSVLHLLGYDHTDEAEDKRIMRTREKTIMTMIDD